jgi:hypothetical protein
MTKGRKAKAKPADGGNLAFAQAMHGKHNLTHDPRPRRTRTRAAAKRRALKDW